MQHVKPLKTDSSVHAVRDATTTWCNWKYISDRTLNGNRVPLAAATPAELTCIRCAGAMNREFIQLIQLISPAETEKLFEELSKLADESKRNSYSKGKRRRDTTAV